MFGQAVYRQEPGDVDVSWKPHPARDMTHNISYMQQTKPGMEFVAPVGLLVHWKGSFPNDLHP